MTTFAIEKGIPLKPLGSGRHRKYPLNELEVGDSFFVPDGVLRKISPAAAGVGKRHNKKFATRKVDGGIRVWRVE